MRVINLFGGYFLALIIIDFLLLSFLDANEFKKKGQFDVEKKAKLVSKVLIIVGVALFIARFSTK